MQLVVAVIRLQDLIIFRISHLHDLKSSRGSVPAALRMSNHVLLEPPPASRYQTIAPDINITRTKGAMFYARRREESSKLGSGLRGKADVAHKQRVDASLAERGDRVGRRADDRLAVVQRGVENERHAGSIEEA